MNTDHHGQVITFYSFKGGTGRTMALANVAWILAERGKRVLVADWDLESPGLHRFFHPFLGGADVRRSEGIIDMIREFENKGINPQREKRPEGWVKHFANSRRYAIPVHYQFTEGGSIDFVSAGRQNPDYKSAVGALDWDAFYTLGGGEFFDALRADFKSSYDYVLIDSRTGHSDVADICTLHLPDVLVDCFTFSDQGIDGAANVAQAVRERYGYRAIRVLPVPMRVDLAEKDKVDAGRSQARVRFADLPAGLADEERDRYWFDVEVPYHAWYAYEETLATFGDPHGAKTSLLTAYENITRAVTGGAVTSMPRLDEAVRQHWRNRFQRKQVIRVADVSVLSAPRDQVWHEWLERLLPALGLAAASPATAEKGTGASRPLVVVSASYVDKSLPRPDGALAVYVDDTPPLPEYPAERSEFLGGLQTGTAVARVADLLGRPVPTDDNLDARIGRFPGQGPDFLIAPIANVHFTGRNDALTAVRQRLRQSRAGGPSVVALSGLGGVGKTQVALEYVHRFGAAYDLVYWINAEPKVLIDTAFADLGERLGLARQPNVLLSIRAVQEALSSGERFSRWLLVFDNVEDYADIERFLPQGWHGDVLVTTRNQAWDKTSVVPVELFTRAESVAHLRRRVPEMSAEDADQIADLLGDLPIALAVGGALLATSGTTPAQYRQQIAAGEPGEAVDAVWEVSLSQLEKTSPGAYRLLEICSILAPDIALDVLNHTAMIDLVRQVDSTLPRRPNAAKLIQQLNRLALLKLDNSARRVQVHRLVQNVVRKRMSLEKIEATQRDVLRVFVVMRPEDDVDNGATWDRYRAIWPHLEVHQEEDRAAELPRSLFEMALASDDPEVLELIVDRIRYIWVRGTHEQSSRLAEVVERAWQARLAATTDAAERERILVPLLRAQFNHANALRDQGRFQEAFDLDTDTLGHQLTVLGESHPDTLMTAGGLGGDLRALGRYGQALDRDRETHATWSQEFGDDYPRTLAALHNLGASLRLSGDFAAARDHDERAVQRREVVLGRGKYFTLYSQGALARDLRELGDYERSIALLREVVAGFTTDRGPQAAVTLSAQVSLAVSIRSAGRAVDAQPLLDEAYTMLLRQFGAEHPETLACRLSRSTNLLSLQRYEEARSETVAVRKAYDDRLGAEHPHTLVCQNNLSAIERAQGDLDAAAAAVEIACAGFTRTLHENHPFLLAARTNRLIYRYESGAARGPVADEAEALADHMRRVLGDRHPDTVRVQANASLIRRGGDVDPEMVAQLAAVLGTDHAAVTALREGRALHRILDPHPF
jgi:tetratricopeptide (TPR) repeat protein/CO dehydrogenase nickel-insertion accessory protein CooC1